ncbi:MAG: hypothetical protein AAFX80_04685 [Cyanobacteria bacterium J06639_18]
MKRERAQTKIEAEELERMLASFLDSYVCALGLNKTRYSDRYTGYISILICKNYCL